MTQERVGNCLKNSVQSLDHLHLVGWYRYIKRKIAQCPVLQYYYPYPTCERVLQMCFTMCGKLNLKTTLDDKGKSLHHIPNPTILQFISYMSFY